MPRSLRHEREANKLRLELEHHRLLIEQHNKAYAAALFIRNNAIVRAEEIRLQLEKETSLCRSANQRLEKLLE